MITFTRSEWTHKFKEVFLHLRLVHPPYFHVTDSGVADFDSGTSRIIALMTLSVANTLRASFHETSGKASASWGSIRWVFIFVTFFLLPSAAWCSKVFASEKLEKSAKIKYSFFLFWPLTACTFRKVKIIVIEHGFYFGEDSAGLSTVISNIFRNVLFHIPKLELLLTLFILSFVDK